MPVKSVRGLQEMQRAMLKAIAAVNPAGGAFGRVLKTTVTQAHRMAVYFTHVDTSALRNSHVINQESITRWRIYIHPTATNPRSGQRTSVYGVAEHNRGGDHAFYEQTYKSGKDLLKRSAAYIVREMP